MTRDIEATLADYIATAASAELPEDVVIRTRCHLLDTLAAILSGRFLAAGEFGYRFAEATGAGTDATLLGSDRKTGVEMAAFANAMAAHADETDDSHVQGRFHPGCGIIPASLAVAEREQATADRLLKAIALGYDIGARSTMALGYTSPRTAVFSTHAFGALFGAAASAGALIGVSAAQANALLSFAVQQASGLPYWNRDPDHIEKSFDFGARAARNGVFAALLAKAGMTAPDHPLTGPRSYLEAYAETSDPEQLSAGLGARFEILNASIKKWSVGSPIQSVLDAIEALYGGRSVAPESIARVTVHLPSNRIHIVDDKHMPAVCAQHLVAMSLLHGKVSFALSHDVGMMDHPAILALRKKITLVPSETLTEARPERQSIVEVERADGTLERHHTKVVRGTPTDPMPPSEVGAKAADILGPILPDGGKRLITLCLQEDFTLTDLLAASRIKN